MALQHGLWHGERVEVRQHHQHGGPPEEVQVQHGGAARGGHPAALHVLHPRVDQGGPLFTLCAQTRGLNLSPLLQLESRLTHYSISLISHLNSFTAIAVYTPTVVRI